MPWVLQVSPTSSLWLTSNTTSATTWTISNCTSNQTVTMPATVSTMMPPFPPTLTWMAQMWRDDINRWQNDIDQQVGDLNMQIAHAIAQPHVRSSARQVDLRRLDAEDKARDLLLTNLTESQRETLRKNKWFVIQGRSGQLYRVRDVGHVVANIEVIERDLLGHERMLHRLCGHIGDSGMPIADHLLAQKLMLEADEDAFLRLANRHI